MSILLFYHGEEETPPPIPPLPPLPEYEEESFVLRDRYGRSVNLSNASGLWVDEHDGLAMPVVERVMVGAPGVDGATQVAARWLPRTITLRVRNVRHDLLSWSLRQYLIRILNQRDEPLYLDVTTAEGVFRLDVLYSGQLSGRRAAQHDGFDTLVLQLVARWPFYYLPTPEVYRWWLAGIGEPATEIPMQIPTPVGGGETDVNATVRILNMGTYLSMPIIRLDGPISDPVIENETTGEKLDFTGASISAGSYWVIDCRTGYKTVLDGTGANKIDKLTNDSDLATFHLAVDPEADSGLNVLRLTGTGIGSATRAAVTYYTYFLGI